MNLPSIMENCINITVHIIYKSILILARMYNLQNLTSSILGDEAMVVVSNSEPPTSGGMVDIVANPTCSVGTIVGMIVENADCDPLDFDVVDSSSESSNLHRAG
ncbi:unnamed protein product [Orchesella dallaii]|uniref:Uncharacterized protein n=1 Tax=Orchesella dallaii TaxID=48710 RepID=A0ABP1RGU2_9HEXA